MCPVMCSLHTISVSQQLVGKANSRCAKPSVDRAQIDIPPNYRRQGANNSMLLHILKVLLGMHEPTEVIQLVKTPNSKLN